ncbi:mRNA capping enzyme family protein, partial [Striga asiatica]
MMHLINSYHLVACNGDGNNLVLMLATEGCFLIDVDFHMRETSSNSGKQQRRFYLSGVSIMDGYPVRNLRFNERWNIIENQLLMSRQTFFKLSASKIEELTYRVIPKQQLKESSSSTNTNTDRRLLEWDSPALKPIHLKFVFKIVNRVHLLYVNGENAELLQIGRQQPFLTK